MESTWVMDIPQKISCQRESGVSSTRLSRLLLTLPKFEARFIICTPKLHLESDVKNWLDSFVKVTEIYAGTSLLHVNSMYNNLNKKIMLVKEIVLKYYIVSILKCKTKKTKK